MSPCFIFIFACMIEARKSEDYLHTSVIYIRLQNMIFSGIIVTILRNLMTSFVVNYAQTIIQLVLLSI